MKAVYVMHDGQYVKIGISSHPKIRRSHIAADIGRRVDLKREFWISDVSDASRVEIMAHALAGAPVRGKEWFDIDESAASSCICEAVKRIGATIVEGHTPSRRKSVVNAQRAYEGKLKDRGVRVVTVRLNEASRKELKRRAKHFGSQSAAIEFAVNKEYERMIAAREAGAAYP